MVIDKEREVYEQYYANAYRGVYRFGALVDEARWRNPRQGRAVIEGRLVRER